MNQKTFAALVLTAGYLVALFGGVVYGPEMIAAFREAYGAEAQTIEGLKITADKGEVVGFSFDMVVSKEHDAMPWPPDPLMRMTINKPAWRGNVKPGEIKLACVYYEANKIIVNPCPGLSVGPQGGLRIINGPTP